MKPKVLKASTSTFIVLVAATFALALSLFLQAELDMSKRSHHIGFWTLNALIVAGTIAQIAHIWHKENHGEHKE